MRSVGTPTSADTTWLELIQKKVIHLSSECEHNYQWSKYCGANVCSKCGDHKGLARCFCGWPAGEKLEDDIGESTWNPVEETWEVDY